MGRMGGMGDGEFLETRKTSAYAEATPTVDKEDKREWEFLETWETWEKNSAFITYYLLLIT